jgi:hypothetical protein
LLFSLVYKFKPDGIVRFNVALFVVFIGDGNIAFVFVLGMGRGMTAFGDVFENADIGLAVFGNGGNQQIPLGYSIKEIAMEGPK